MKKEKKLTPNMLILCKKLDAKLAYGEEFSKAELEAYLFPGCTPGSRDRQLREVIQNVKAHRPLINLSSKGNIRRATSCADYNDVKHQIAENISRANEILKANKPLDEFCARIEKQAQAARG